MESPSGFGPAGIGIQDCSLTVRELSLASGLESASLAGLAGDGDTGDTIGITTGSFSTTAPTVPTAEFSPTATTSIALVDSIAAALPAAEASVRRIVDSEAPTPVRSAVSIMEAWQEASPPEGSRALAEASTEVEVSTAAVAVEGNAGQLTRSDLIWRKNSCAQTI
jgi:hypothetical protein